VNQPSDNVLMDRVRENHLEALGVLFKRHHPRIHALCCRLTGDADAADDLTQDTFLRVLRYRHAFRGDAAFSTWLHRLAYNVCCDYLRRSQREEFLGDADRTEQRATDRSDGSDTDATHARLEAAMARLSPEQRAVLVLRRYDDLGFAEIARVLECTPVAARVRAHRALHELREIYRDLEQRGS
jgi:RNA polymerase sigma-70 factor, ECF subfamily